MIDDICQELNLLLDVTRELLDCSEPSLEAWQGYSKKRHELLGGLQVLMPFEAESEGVRVKLQSLIATTLENDVLLKQKIQHHLSNFRHQMVAAKEQRRAFKAYASIAGTHSSIDRCKA
jgi:hypothetical protein